MAFRSLHARIQFVFSLLSLCICSMPAYAQTAPRANAEPTRSTTAVSDNSQAESSSLSGLGFYSPGSDIAANSANTGLPLLEVPEPAALGGGTERYDATPAGVKLQAPFSRIGIGADVSPLGIGIKSAIILSGYFDARLMGNYFNYNGAEYEIEGFHLTTDLHLASVAAALDWYPFNSIWRLSAGLLLMNDNKISAAAIIIPGTDFALNDQDFYSANANPATGATPLRASGVLGLHSTRPAFAVSGGFGRFIPRSNRHWSFPSEFGVAFTGAPSVNVNTSGWVCTDKALTNCSDVSVPTNPVAIQFNTRLQAELTKWRHDLSGVRVYPLFSYSVVYSFNFR